MPAPKGGVLVALSCDKPETAKVDPGSLVIAEGQVEGRFTITGIGQPLMSLQHIDATVSAAFADRVLTAPLSIYPETPVTPIQGSESPLVSVHTAQLELEILNVVNQFRLSKQLQVLASDDSCATQARSHSIDMAVGRVGLGHDGFDLRSAAIGSSAPGHPPGAAEQVAAGKQTAQEVVQGWLQETILQNRSPVEGPYTMAGVGVAISPSGMNYFTIMFA